MPYVDEDIAPRPSKIPKIGTSMIPKIRTSNEWTSMIPKIGTSNEWKYDFVVVNLRDPC